MSESSNEPEVGISDDKLPEDLIPGEDNPLAESLEDGESVGDLLEDGKAPEGSQEPIDEHDAPGSAPEG